MDIHFRMSHAKCFPVFSESAIYGVMHRPLQSQFHGQEAIILFTYNRTSCCPSDIDSGSRRIEDTEGGLHILNRAVGAHTFDLSTLGSFLASLDSNGLKSGSEQQ